MLHPVRKVASVLAAALAFISWLPLASSAAGEAEAEALVREQTFEGRSLARAEAITADGAAHLEALLEDDDERPIHAAILEVLGMSGKPGAFEAIARYSAHVPTGEVDAATYRARLAIPIALGHLARKDDRALQMLIARARSQRAPGWHRRYLKGDRLALQLREVSVAALGLSGRDEAADALAGLEGEPALRSQAQEARARCHRVAREGAARALASPFVRGPKPEGKGASAEGAR